MAVVVQLKIPGRCWRRRAPTPPRGMSPLPRGGTCLPFSPGTRREAGRCGHEPTRHRNGSTTGRVTITQSNNQELAPMGFFAGIKRTMQTTSSASRCGTLLAEPYQDPVWSAAS
jgi:hypothetical protein